ncbi:MAG: glycosyltransferase family 39 protein [Chloroflexi bacterium]|nr:glycosyltransferase family 39 protein [Chloroflexota bacterium]
MLAAALTGHAAVTIPASVGLMLAWVVIRYCFSGVERQAMSMLLLAGFAIRAAAALALHPFLITNQRRGDGRIDVYRGFLFEDDRAFDVVSWALARLWSGELANTAKSQDYLINNYTVMMGWVYYLFDHDVVGPKLLNCLFGALTVVVAYALAKELSGPRAGYFAAALALVFPSTLLWSILNLKDTLVVLLIGLTMLGGLKFSRRPSIIWAVVTVASFAALENLRLYVFFALGWLLWIAFFVINRKPWRERLKYGVPFALALLSVVYITNETQSLGLRYLSAKRLEALASSREFGAKNAETGIVEVDDLPRSAADGYTIQLRTAPKVLPYVLWGPFPWMARSAREFAVIPETLVWYGMQILIVAGLIGRRRDRWRELFLPLAFCAGLSCIFSLIEGNVGTIYRHRAMLLLPAFAMAGLGFDWLLTRQFRRVDRQVTASVSPMPGARAV